MSLALIFPGQGAQTPAMGAGVLDAGSPGNAMAREASELVGLDLVRLACDADAEEIRPTEVAQPLLLLLSAALLETLPVETRAQVTSVAGHSLGEYTALVAAGSLDWRDALQLVRERGLAMAEAARGPGQGMSAVLGADEEAVAEALAGAGDGVAVVANINAPGQVVISGHLAALEEAGERLKAAGARRVMPLEVAGAFHSPLMADAALRLAAAIDAAPLRTGIPQAFNVDGAVRTEPADIAAALRLQLTSPVRWTACVRTLVDLGVDQFLELGPGTTLSAMGKRINPDVSWTAAATPQALAAVEV
ncbi:MAG TPA: acyltransferase domain-containing protein [Candidatus Solibacter sp.]|nr:acyltransferase domain-containing protein [Candidatus Solibacter sp.]